MTLIAGIEYLYMSATVPPHNMPIHTHESYDEANNEGRECSPVLRYQFYQRAAI